MKVSILAVLVLYLVPGLAFAIATQPDQMYACPDASSPSGEMTYGGLDSAPAPDCHPTVTTGERVQWMAFATPAWLPLTVAKGLAND